MRVGNYRLLNIIYDGRHKLYLAEDVTVPGSTYVVKELLYDSSIPRIIEADVMTRIKHPNLLALRQLVLTNDAAYLVLPYIASKLTVHNLTLNARYRYIWYLLNAVAWLHDCGIVHCDIKLSNIMLDNGQPILLDFDLAEYTGNAISKTNTKGTSGYKFPIYYFTATLPTEVLDLWSAGITCYSILTGKKPVIKSLNDLHNREHIKKLPPLWQPLFDSLLSADIVNYSSMSQVLNKFYYLTPRVLGTIIITPGPLDYIVLPLITDQFQLLITYSRYYDLTVKEFLFAVDIFYRAITKIHTGEDLDLYTLACVTLAFRLFRDKTLTKPTIALVVMCWRVVLALECVLYTSNIYLCATTLEELRQHCLMLYPKDYKQANRCFNSWHKSFITGSVSELLPLTVKP